MNPKWIVIVQQEWTGVTGYWCIKTRDLSAVLGVVKFYPQWRKFAFFPNVDTLYEQDCLRDIATFCESQTELWRASRRQARKEAQAR